MIVFSGVGVRKSSAMSRIGGDPTVSGLPAELLYLGYEADRFLAEKNLTTTSRRFLIIHRHPRMIPFHHPRASRAPSSLIGTIVSSSS